MLTDHKIPILGSYHPDMCRLVKSMSLLGSTDKEMAEALDITDEQLGQWREKYPEFNQAYNEGKTLAEARVAEALFNKACGMKVKKSKVLSSGKIVEFEEEIPPDVRAIEYILSCRTRGDRAQWVNSHNVNISGDEKNPLAFILDQVGENAKDLNPIPNKNPKPRKLKAVTDV